MRNFWLILSVLWLWTCSGGGDKATGPEEPPIVINLTSLGGQAQKGPFNNGTAINIAELTNTLSPTGRNFSSAITDNSGRFAVSNVQLESPYVELRANGYYFNEVSNEISSGQLTLFALSNLTGKTSLNVNILTHLEKNRMVTLMSGDNPKTFAQAKLQAQEEVLAIFDYSRANVPESELLDISQDGAANAKLLAMSAIIQGNLTVGQMSQLLANISTDIASDGTLDDTNLRNTLIENSKNLDMAEVRSNIVAHYTSLGISATIPDFETEINQFLKPPVAQDMSVSTGEDTPINITLAASDPEDESLTYTILEVNNATVTLNGNVATYAPNAHFNGTDTFTYKANDGTSDSNIATVTMTVSAEDDEPNTLDVATTTDEDVAVAVNLSAEEYDGDSYSFAIVTDVSNGTTSLNGSTVTYTPNQDFNGEDTFTFEATDDTGRTMNVATATITVNPVNDAPVANNITNQVTDENRMMQLDITLDATDVDGDALTYNVTSTNNGTVTINDNIATYVPTQDWNGEDTFTYVANDGSLDSNTATVTITVNSVNDAPVTSNSEMTIDEDSLDGEFTKITDYATDVDGDALVYIITKLPFGGNLCQNAGATCGTVLAVGDTVTGENGIENSNPFYMPNENWHGQDQFEWKVNDGVFDSNISKVTVNVNAINDLPVVTNITTSTSEDNPVTFSVHNNITDPDGDSTHWSYFVETQPANGIVTVEDSNNGNYTYTPNENFNGTDSFTWYIYDDGNGPEPGNSNVATTTITVNSVNDVPVVNDTTATGVKNTTFKFFLPEAYDLESGSETSFHNSLILVSAPGNGTLFKNNNEGNDSVGNSLSVGDKINNTDDGNQARIWYQPSTDWSGTDTFTYKANDGEDDSNIATVTITVTNPRLNTGWGGTWRPYTSFNVSTIETETFNQPNIAIKKSSNGQTVKSYSPALSGNIDYSFALPPIKSDDYYISVSMESADGGSNYTMTAPSNFSLVNPGLISYDGYDINNIADIVFNPNNNRVYIVGEMTPENQSNGRVNFGMHYNIGDDAVKYDAESDTYYRNDLNIGTNNGFTLQYTSDLDAIPYDLQGTTDRMIYTSDNDIIVWDPNTYEHGSNNSEKHIVKLDWDSTLNGYEWDFDYSSWGSSNSLSSLIIADIHEVNGDFILTGYDGSNSEKKMVIIKLNSAGSVDYFNTFSSNSLGSDYYYRGFGSSIKISDSSFIIAGSSFKENFNCQNYVSVFRISDTGSSFSLIDQSNHPNPDCSLSDDAGNMYAVDIEKTNDSSIDFYIASTNNNDFMTQRFTLGAGADALSKTGEYHHIYTQDLRDGTVELKVDPNDNDVVYFFAHSTTARFYSYKYINMSLNNTFSHNFNDTSNQYSYNFGGITWIEEPDGDGYLLITGKIGYNSNGGSNNSDSQNGYFQIWK